MNLLRLYPNYIKQDRRQESKPVSFERRFNHKDRRDRPRPVLLRKLIKDIKKIKGVFEF